MTFLKWPGSKRQLIKHIDKVLPTVTGRYVDPMVGGGSVSFFMLKQNRASSAIISDSNPELITAFQAIKYDVSRVISALQGIVSNGISNTPEWYYALRSINLSDKDEFFRAARMIALNKTCFNGLYRVNSKGIFNAAFGDNKNVTICKPDELEEDSAALQKADIYLADVLTTLSKIETGDFVYLDPPYVIQTKTANFTHFTKERFTDDNLRAIIEVCKTMKDRGIRFLMSNSDKAAPFIEGLGFQTQTISALRLINTKGSGRGRVPELLIWNY